ncbi:MAG: DUF2007-related protein [Bacteroidales bacterium]|nr:DUF2007-related protein [Bacteroidales bacterium]
MKGNKDISPVEVFAGSFMQASLVKSLLEDTGIEAFLKDEYMGTLNPWHAAPGGVEAVKVFVSDRDYEKAKIVVREYERKTR